MATTKNAKALSAWQDLKKRIEAATAVPSFETPKAKAKRIERLEANFFDWCKYYFPDFCKSDFAWFHKAAAPAIIANPHSFTVLEWPREHAKSVFIEVFIVSYLYFKGQIKSLVLISQTETKAIRLLGDIQAQFEANQRLIYDYGDHRGFGSWSDGSFRTANGVGFYAYGAGQSARGIRDAAQRPNFCIVDDIDTDQRCKNEDLVDEVLSWLRKDIFGACSINQARFIVAGNRIHKRSILAKLVGNIEDADPINEGITHYSRVYAFEDENHQKSDHILGRPAWKENYTTDTLLKRFALIGYKATRSEFFHEHIAQGKVFSKDWIAYTEPAPLHQYDHLVTYCDPSYKDTKKNDYKAIVLIGLLGSQIHILDAWVRQATLAAMVQVHYRIGYDLFLKDVNCQHYMESNFIQDQHLNLYKEHGKTFGWTLPIRGDDRKKPDKSGRIEGLSPLFERGLVSFSETQRKSVDIKTLIDQFLAFPTGHDDGPDAVEGAIYKLRRKMATSAFKDPLTSHSKPTHSRQL